ncbi:MAG TPA: divergent polysaccharide deacetylase family protein [Magnetospirillaceae bacterium]|nr:divergent polysaccharide deacetylase family protein [Magnetospirillaceae bacterium]
MPKPSSPVRRTTGRPGANGRTGRKRPAARKGTAFGPGLGPALGPAFAAALIMAALAIAALLIVAVPERPEPPSGRTPGTLGYEAPGPGVVTPPPPGGPAVPAGLPSGGRGPSAVPERPEPPRGRIVLVIDDAGHNLQDLEPFLAFPGPLSIAVLPRLPHSEESARRILAAGKEVLLHQPMEALGGEDPGPGAVRLGMDYLQIAAVIAENLTTVPGAVGMNNHMGSAATRDTETMGAVLEAARAAGLYFLDSFTVSDSVVHSVASRLNLRIWERDVFLDNYPERAAMLKQFDEGAKRAEKKGLSVMIGHIWSAELAQTLVDLYPGLIEQGFSLTTISRIMLEDSDEDTGD